MATTDYIHSRAIAGASHLGIDVLDLGSPQSILLNSTLSASSGFALGAYFVAPETLGASGEVHGRWYCVSVVGAPEVALEIREISGNDFSARGPLIGTPGAPALAAANTWVAFPPITGCNLVAGTPYGVYVFNASADPVANTANMASRGKGDLGAAYEHWTGIQASAGWDANWSETNFGRTGACLRLRNSDPTPDEFHVGAVYWGTKLVAANTNLRGARIILDADLVVCGCETRSLATTVDWTYRISRPDGSVVASAAVHPWAKAKGIARHAPITLAAGQPYLVTYDPATLTNSWANNLLHMNAGTPGAPADVQACGFQSRAGRWGYVNAPTLPELEASLDLECFPPLTLIVDQWSGGGGGGPAGGMFVNPGLGGGISR